MEPFDPLALQERDLQAMKLAIEDERAQGGPQREAIDARLRDQAWHEVGQYAAWRCQDRHLRLRAWDCPPCRTRDVEDPSDDWGYRPAEVALLKRMFAAGVSRFDPDPLKAIAETEQR